MAPVGLLGELTRMTLVRGVTAASMSATVGTKPASARAGYVLTSTPTAAAAMRQFGNSGSGTSISSPGPMVALMAIARPCIAPWVTTTSSAATASPLDSPTFCARAVRSSSDPMLEV